MKKIKIYLGIVPQKKKENLERDYKKSKINNIALKKNSHFNIKMKRWILILQI